MTTGIIIAVLAVVAFAVFAYRRWVAKPPGSPLSGTPNPGPRDPGGRG